LSSCQYTHGVTRRLLGPHDTLPCVLINPLVQSIIKQSMSVWNTTLSVGSSIMGHIKIQCGIFQGDSMSPLLFCLALNPLSEVIKSTAYGYTVKSGQLFIIYG